MYMFNPVVNLLAMASSSIYNEWTWNEALNSGQIFDYARDLTDEQTLDLKRKSIAFKEFDPSSKTKILISLGENDTIVYPQAGELLFKKLKSIGLDITCRKYKFEQHVFVLAMVNFEIRMQILLDCYPQSDETVA